MGINTGATSKYCCISVQQALDNIVGANNPGRIVVETNGFTKALYSPLNMNGFEMVQTASRRGKALPDTGNRTVEIAYTPRVCAAVAETVPNVCDTGTLYADDFKYATVSVDEVRSTTLRISKEQYRQLCEDPGDAQMRAITNRINDLKKAYNEAMIAKYITVLGNYYTVPGGVPVDSGANPKTLLLFNAAMQTNALAMMPVQSDYKRSGWSGSPIVVGGQLLENWAYAAKVFAGNQDGFDLNKAGIPGFFADFAIDPIFNDGDQHIFTWVPGFVQPLEWYQFPEGSVYEELKPDYQETTLDFGGFKVDFTVRYDECTHMWNLTFAKHFDLFAIPNDSIAATCDQDSTGILQWLADCGDLDCNYAKL